MLKFKPRDSGFSLLELVITISVLSIGLTVVLQALSASSKATRFSNELVAAVLLGTDLIQELEFKEESHTLTQSDLNVVGEKGSIFWSVQSSQLPDSDSLFLLDIGLKWKSFLKERNFSFKTLAIYEKI
jgi:prepilin-type N-terminal cleavage/methylation domain-containing protein